MTEVLGRLRREGRIDVPVCAAITDLAALHYWATPGADIHFITHPESIAEVRASPARDAECTACTGSRAGVPRPAAMGEARAALGLPIERQDRARLGRRLGRR